MNALCTSTQHPFVFSKGLCCVPFPNSSSTALFGRADISSGGYLTNIFRNNLHGGSHVCTSAFARADSQVSRFCQTQRQVTLITLAVIWMWRAGLAQKSSTTHSETAQPASVIWTEKGFCSRADCMI